MCSKDRPERFAPARRSRQNLSTTRFHWQDRTEPAGLSTVTAVLFIRRECAALPAFLRARDGLYSPQQRRRSGSFLRYRPQNELASEGSSCHRRCSLAGRCASRLGIPCAVRPRTNTPNLAFRRSDCWDPRELRNIEKQDDAVDHDTSAGRMNNNHLSAIRYLYTVIMANQISVLAIAMASKRAPKRVSKQTNNAMTESFGWPGASVLDCDP